MKLESIRTFLSTLLEYRGVRITQTFNSDDGKTLIVQCEPNSGGLIIRDMAIGMSWEYTTLDEATQFIDSYLHPETPKVNA
ncbi:hypothetical protein H1Q58_12090 [Planococcus maritimus]|uniref:Uncharacterized protein n=1 Tax=Planococcus maritimus TaxID=192421 RepID=A0A1C7E2F4_PLAMR|nr:hypothetical protein [Planococcus maritimus]ANU17855.1 hypothetical protein BBI11_12790 [Planococcus maritimus]QMT16704.1 hypothetical protein H1Q58_12090 [Planococcus maritimus]